ncbi:MAG: YraN family protein [Edaphobacter sp.]
MTIGAVGKVWVDLQARVMKRLDGMGTRGGERAEHLVTGERGEREALFYLRKLGYTVVARRWKSSRLRGDVDLIGWDGACLCFVEVKTRGGRDAGPAELAVDEEKQKMLRRMARAYLGAFPKKLSAEVSVRFDVVSVYLLPSGVECELFREAFGW